MGGLVALATFTRMLSAPARVIDTDGVVHALAADTGAELWRASTANEEGNKGARFGGGVSVEGERAFASNGLGDVVALNVADGTVIWRKRPGGPLRGAPTLANGNAYVVTQDNQLFALSQDTGEIGWTVSASLETQGVFGVAAPASAQGTVIAGFSSGELNAYRFENGRVVWQDALARTSISTSVASLSDIDADAVIDGGDSAFARAELATLRAVFAHVEVVLRTRLSRSCAWPTLPECIATNFPSRPCAWAHELSRGWGVISVDGARLSWIAHGVIAPDDKAPMAERLLRHLPRT